MGELKQAEARRTRLEQRCRFEGGPGGEEDTSLLHHWVEELDEFREEEVAFMAKLRCAAYSSSLFDKKNVDAVLFCGINIRATHRGRWLSKLRWMMTSAVGDR